MSTRKGIKTIAVLFIAMLAVVELRPLQEFAWSGNVPIWQAADAVSRSRGICRVARQLHCARGGKGAISVLPPRESLVAALPRRDPTSVAVNDPARSSTSGFGPESGGGWSATDLTVALVTAAAVAVAYADRSVVSVASLAMREELGYGYELQGDILGAFFVGYGLTQVVAGSVADKKGGRDVLATGVAVWAFATLVTPVAARNGFSELLAARVLLGAAEGVCFPAVHALIAANVAKEKQSGAVAVATAASYIGIAAAFLVSPTLVESNGWPSAFYVFGALAALWLPLAALLPDARADQSAAANDGAFPETVDVNWELLRTPQALAIMLAQYANSYGMYGLLSWLPTFLSERAGASSAEKLGEFAAAPYFAQAVFGVVAGVIADAALSKGVSRRNVRVASQTLGMLIPAACLLLAVRPGVSPGEAISLITIGTTANALTLAGVSANGLDVAPSNAGQLFAAGNTAATLAGLVAVPLTGSILGAADGSEAGWSTAFALCSAHYVLGAGAFALLAGGERIPEDIKTSATLELAEVAHGGAHAFSATASRIWIAAALLLGLIMGSSFAGTVLHVIRGM